MVERGRDFTISKRTEFDALSHKPLTVRYTLTREGLPEPRGYARLSEAREDATKPIEALVPPPPPPPPEPAPTEVAETAAPGTSEAASDDAPPEDAATPEGQPPTE